MARGNVVDLVKLNKRFGFLIATPFFEWQSFGSYRKIYFSKRGTLIGEWGGCINGKPFSYKDYISISIPRGAELVRRTDKYLFFKCMS